jgi:hypothetical protein
MSRRNLLLIVLVPLALAALAYYCARHPADFRVYYFGAMGVFDGTRPMYGETSGIGWPMHYRYPPLFLFLITPFTLLPLAWASALWAVLKAFALAYLVFALWKQLGETRNRRAFVIPVLLGAPYVIEDLRYGNAQSFILVASGLALLRAKDAPNLSGTLLGIGIAIKLWPLFFIPYLVIRGFKRVALIAAAVAVLSLLLPSFYFGAGGNFALLQQWFDQEFSTQLGSQEIWFPSQSARGVAMRYLTEIDYSRVPDSNYVSMTLVKLNPDAVKRVWFAGVVLAYAGLLYLSRNTRVPDLLLHAIAFTLLPLLQPFTQKYALVVLLFPALVAGRLVLEGKGKAILFAAVLLAVGQPLVPGASSQRLMQVIGVDFIVSILIVTVFLYSYRHGARLERNRDVKAHAIS